MDDLSLVILIGRVSHDPDVDDEHRDECRFRVAVNKYYRTTDRGIQRFVTTVPVKVWGSLATRCAHGLTRGMQVRITGRLEGDRYPHRDQVLVAADTVVWAGPSHEALVAGAPSAELDPEPAAPAEASG